MHQVFIGALDYEIVSSPFEFSRNLKKVPVIEIKLKELNLKLFWKNYSSYHRFYIFLEYLIPKRII